MRPRRVERHGSVRHRDGRSARNDGRAVHLRDRQRVAIDIAVVGEDRRRDRGVLVRREAVIHRNRRIVHRIDGDRPSVAVGQRPPGSGVAEVAGQHRQRDAAVEVRGR